MKIVFATNFLNPHQLPLCEAFLKEKDVEFYFVATTPTPEERLKLGFEDMNNQYGFVVKAYESKEKEERAIKLISEADVVIYGSCKIDCRKYNKNGLLLQHSERLFRKGWYQKKNPFFNLKLRNHYKALENEYFLSASSYLKDDFKFLFVNKGRVIKWGYFTELYHYDEEFFDRKFEGDTVKMVWIGRLLKLKRPEMALKCAEHLKEKGCRFTLDFYGDGPEENTVRNYIKEHKLDDCVSVKGPLPYKEVRKRMEEAHVFIFSSNSEEGWGAVLNEAMNSGCVCFSSVYAGATDCLIKEGENGFSFKSQDELNRKVEAVINNKKRQKEIGKKAYETIATVWNAEEAAGRLINICKGYKETGKIAFLEEGPGSYDW